MVLMESQMGATDKTFRHDPVMVQEILAVLALNAGDVVVDGTLGLGGHTLRFIDAVRPGGTVVGFDWDSSMLEIARARIGTQADVKVHLVHKDFREMADVLVELSLRPNGILLDLGLNSAQIDDPGRGITFREEGPLDMRMDRTRGEPASAVLNRIAPGELEWALKEYADERWARAIAKQVVARRKQQPLRTTQDLVDCVHAAIPVGAREKRIHPATRTFQAVRILVNGELNGLAEAVEAAAMALAAGGSLAILSYHSGEDRIVKDVFKSLQDEGFEIVTKKPQTPTEVEIRENSRSRSAKLRVIRKQ